MSLWNSLDETVRSSSTITSFKNNIKHVYSNLCVSPPYYIKGDRKLSVLHAGLRNNCSNLKHDLHSNFIEPDSTCRCGYLYKDANHYFFIICSLYLNERVELFHSTVSYHPLSLRTLLFGDQNLSTEDNFIIFRAVHRYIRETKRFDNWPFVLCVINTSGTLSSHRTISFHLYFMCIYLLLLFIYLYYISRI